MMPIKTFITGLFLILLTALNTSAAAENPGLNPFTVGTYRQIMDKYANRPFMIIMWSIDCPSCIKDMELINNIHQSKPEFNIVMIATDDPSVSDKIQQILEQHQLTGIDNWVFADEDAQKLRFEIDPAWYGEIPRTYFFDTAHHRIAVSGVLTKQDYEAMIAKTQN